MDLRSLCIKANGSVALLAESGNDDKVIFPCAHPLQIGMSLGIDNGAGPPVVCLGT